MTDWHDSATKLFKENPQLATDVLRDLLGVPLKEGVKPVPLPQVLSDKPPSDLIPDLVFLIGPARKATRCVIVELQTEMTKSKRRQWPRYTVALWLKYECPVDLLVICPDEATARSCAEPLYTNLEHFVCPPKALPPQIVPALASAEEVAAHPGLAVLSVAYHGEDPKVAEAFVAGTAITEDKDGKNYYDWGYAMSTPAVQQMMEELVNTTYQRPYSPTLRRKYDEGMLEERRASVLRVIEARGLTPTDEQRKLVEKCEDLDTLALWVERAVGASSTDDIFK